MDSRLLFYVDTRWRRYALFAGVGAGIAGIAFAIFLAQAIVAFIFPENATLSVNHALGWAVCAALIRVLCMWAQSYSAGQLSSLAKSRVRQDLVERLGIDSQTLLLQGVESLDGWYAQYLPQLTLARIIPMLVLLTTLFWDPWSALVFAVTAPLLIIFLALIGLATRKRQQAQWKQLLLQGRFYRETLLGLKSLRQWGRSGSWGHRLARSAELLRRHTLGVLRMAFLSSLALELVATIGTAILAVSVGLRLLYGEVGYAEALTALLLAPEFYQPLRQLGLRTHAAMEAQATMPYLFPQTTDNVVCTPQSLQSSIAIRDQNALLSSPMTLIEGQFTLRMQNLSLRWPGQAQAMLRNFSLGLGPGEKVALCGDSGAGKSSLFAALLGRLIPEEGSIEFAPGVRLAWVPQHPSFLPRSLRANLWLRPDPSSAQDSMLQDAMRRVGLGAFLASLPLAFDTPLGEGGARLSGGQARRLALARALLQEADVILLDEPDAHMDEPSLLAFEELVSGLAGVAVLLITHSERTRQLMQRTIWLSKEMRL